MFVGIQNFTDLWAHNFVGNNKIKKFRIFVNIRKEIQACSWGRKCMGKSDP
jgi:hypothetical protein